MLHRFKRNKPEVPRAEAPIKQLVRAISIRRLIGNPGIKRPLADLQIRNRTTEGSRTLGTPFTPRRRPHPTARRSRRPKNPSLIRRMHSIGTGNIQQLANFPIQKLLPLAETSRNVPELVKKRCPRRRKRKRRPKTSSLVKTVRAVRICKRFNKKTKKRLVMPEPDSSVNMQRLDLSRLAPEIPADHVQDMGTPRAIKRVTGQKNYSPNTPRFIRMRRCSTKTRLHKSDIDFSILSNVIFRRKKTPRAKFVTKKATTPRVRRKRGILRELVPATDKKIFEIMGAIIVYDLRDFTRFCTSCKNDEIPARLIMNIYEFADKVVYRWDGEILSRTGDGFVAIFPRKKSERGKRSIINVLKKALKCSIVLVRKTGKLLKKIEVQNKPKRCGIGIEVGPTQFFKNGKFSALARVSAVSSTINHAQRCDAHSKKLFRTGGGYRPIAMKERLFNLLSDEENLQKIFLKKDWSAASKRNYYKQLMSEPGIPEGTFACACPIERIIHFYKKNRVALRRKRRELRSNLRDLLDRP